MFFTRRLLIGSAVISLAYLGESKFAPVVGSIALHFGQPEAAGYIYISSAFYGAAASGLTLLLLHRERSLTYFAAVALILGAVANVLAIVAGNWSLALALRFIAGACFGTAVACIIVNLAQSESGSALAREISVMFSMAFLGMAPVVVVVPILAPRIGLTGLCVVHLLLCSAAAWIVQIGISANSHPMPVFVSRKRRETLRLTFWSGRKSIAFFLHAAHLASALLILIGMQPALAGRGIDEVRIGIVLALLNASTFSGGIMHSWLLKVSSLTYARWAVISSEVTALICAGLLLNLKGDLVPFAIGVILSTKGICGGSPTFEALLYDLGPTDPASSGLQRSLGMVAAILLATTVLDLANWFHFDVLEMIVCALAVGYAIQVCAFAWLLRSSVSTQ